MNAGLAGPPAGPTRFLPGKWSVWNRRATRTEMLRDCEDALAEHAARMSRWLVSEAASEARQSLAVAISARDERQIADSAAKLAGLGEGLTPAGDDYLVGALHAVWLTLARGRARGLAAWIAGAARDRTTCLGSAWIEAAARGQVAPWWQEFFEAPRREARRAAARRIASTGHSSGVASLAGFGATLGAGIRLEEEAL